MDKKIHLLEDGFRLSQRAALSILNVTCITCNRIVHRCVTMGIIGVYAPAEIQHFLGKCTETRRNSCYLLALAAERSNVSVHFPK